MSSATALPLLSVDEYLRMEAASDVRHEYLGGYFYAMAGGQNVHNAIATGFLVAVGARLRGKPCQPFNSDTKVRVRMTNHTRFYYPDAMVVCQPNPPHDAYQDRPVVIAEVVSEATRRIDEGEKRDAYLTIPTLEDYLLIETDRPRVAAHRRTDAGFIARVYEGLDAVLPLDAISCELPLRELYERVDQAAAGPTPR